MKAGDPKGDLAKAKGDLAKAVKIGDLKDLAETALGWAFLGAVVLVAVWAYPKEKPKVLRAWAEIRSELEWPTEQVEERYPNGQLKARGQVFLDRDENQVRTGTWEFWQENGLRRRTETYAHGGLLHGESRIWGPEGSLWQLRSYQKGCVTEIRSFASPESHEKYPCKEEHGSYRGGMRHGWWQSEWNTRDDGHRACYRRGLMQDRWVCAQDPKWWRPWLSYDSDGNLISGAKYMQRVTFPNAEAKDIVNDRLSPLGGLVGQAMVLWPVDNELVPRELTKAAANGRVELKGEIVLLPE